MYLFELAPRIDGGFLVMCPNKGSEDTLEITGPNNAQMIGEDAKKQEGRAMRKQTNERCMLVHLLLELDNNIRMEVCCHVVNQPYSL